MNKKEIKKYLILGLIGALITVIGEMLEGFVIATDTSNEMAKLFSTIELLPVWRIGLGSTIGALGSLMQFYGFYGLYLTFNNKESKLAKMYISGIYVFTIIGAIVHVLMSVLMYVYKISIGSGFIMDRMIEFMIWFVGPITIIFFVFYFTMSIAMLIILFRKQSSYPKWYGLLNPVFGKVVINAIVAVLPASALTNGIGFSDMGISSVILFIMLLANVKCVKESN